MLEHMMQGIARAGGVEIPAGRTILPARPRAVRRPGIARRTTGLVLQRGAEALQAAADRLLRPTPACRATG